MTSNQDLLAVLLWTCGKAVHRGKGCGRGKALTPRSGRMGEEGRKGRDSHHSLWVYTSHDSRISHWASTLKGPTNSQRLCVADQALCMRAFGDSSVHASILLLWLHGSERLAELSLGESPRKVVHEEIQG